MRQGDILAVHPDYFQLTGGLERWLYRLARKAVPDKADPPAIRFKMETLHARSGVTRDLKLFAFDIRKLADTQPLPEYGVQIEYRKGRRELVTLYRDTAKPSRPPRGRRLKTIQGEQVEPAVNVDAYVQEEPQPFVIEPSSLPAITPRAIATPTPEPLPLGAEPELTPVAAARRIREEAEASLEISDAVKQAIRNIELLTRGLDERENVETRDVFRALNELTRFMKERTTAR